MYYHYNILHKNYEIKLNEVIKGTKLAEQFPTLEKLMENLTNLPIELQNDVSFFGGGLINHNFYFAHLIKMSLDEKGKSQHENHISSELGQAIEKKFVNLENLKKELVKNALKVRGSG
jgi:Fe-Mn family superoxide dismutase